MSTLSEKSAAAAAAAAAAASAAWVAATEEDDALDKLIMGVWSDNAAGAATYDDTGLSKRKRKCGDGGESDPSPSKKNKKSDLKKTTKMESELPGIVIDLNTGAKLWKRHYGDLEMEKLKQYKFEMAPDSDDILPGIGVCYLKKFPMSWFWEIDQFGGKDTMHYFDFTIRDQVEAEYCSAFANNFEEMVNVMANDPDHAKTKLQSGINQWLKWREEEQQIVYVQDYLRLQWMLLNVKPIFNELKQKGKNFEKFNDLWEERHKEERHKQLHKRIHG
jgi:hypothetical protein